MGWVPTQNAKKLPDGANLGQHSHGTLKTGGVVSPTCNMVLEWPPAKHKENVATIGPEYRSHNNASGASNPILLDNILVRSWGRMWPWRPLQHWLGAVISNDLSSSWTPIAAQYGLRRPLPPWLCGTVNLVLWADYWNLSSRILL